MAGCQFVASDGWTPPRDGVKAVIQGFLLWFGLVRTNLFN
jgi:hypothetical protein